MLRAAHACDRRDTQGGACVSRDQNFGCMEASRHHYIVYEMTAAIWAPQALLRLLFKRRLRRSPLPIWRAKNELHCFAFCGVRKSPAAQQGGFHITFG
jgi:hypothetical protein